MAADSFSFDFFSFFFSIIRKKKQLIRRLLEKVDELPGRKEDASGQRVFDFHPKVT